MRCPLVAACTVLLGMAASRAAEPPALKAGDLFLTIYAPSREAARDVAESLREDEPASSHRLLEAQARQIGLAVVRECRSLALPKGDSECRLTDIAALIDPTSTQFHDQTDPKGTRVLEQSYHFDLVDGQALLKRFLDRPVELRDPAGVRHTGVLLAPGPPAILRCRDGSIEVIDCAAPGSPAEGYGGFRFPELPKDLVTRPTLIWKLHAEREGPHEVVLAYQTGGMAWRADYAAIVREDAARIDLSGWVTIANVSGTSYPKCRIKLVAGDVRRILPPRPAGRGYAQTAMAGDFFGVEPEPAFKERPFFEYHLYTLRWPTALENRLTKQIEFLNVAGVPARRVYTYDGAQLGEDTDGGPWGAEEHRDETYGTKCRKTVRVNLEFENKEAAQLGVPLPAGIVRVYKLDEADGQREFVGEDEIAHTPRDETVRLWIGDAFDLVGERVRKDFRLPKDNQIRETFEIELRNHKEQPVEIRVFEHLYRGLNWKIEQSTLPFEKLDAQSVAFRAAVPARGKTTIGYTVLYSWPHVGEAEPAEEKP